jgi:hypothetical protein
MAMYRLRGYREYLGNMFTNISRMVPDIPDDLVPYVLASFFIVHGPSFMKIVFLKDNFFFLKDKRYFILFQRMINGANPGLTEKCMMLYSVRYVNFEKNTQAITITEEVAIWQPQSR